MTITHEAPTLPARHTVPLADLTPEQLLIAHVALTHLGVADGVIEDEITETNAGTRAVITWTAALNLGITVSPGHELAQCHGCRSILDGAQVTETDGRLHCTTCRPHSG